MHPGAPQARRASGRGPVSTSIVSAANAACTTSAGLAPWRSTSATGVRRGARGLPASGGARAYGYHSLARMLQWQQTHFERLRPGHRLVVTGLPSPEEIGVALRRMQAGEITVADTMDVRRV